MSQLAKLSLIKIRDLLQTKEVSVQEVLTACLDQIQTTEPQIAALLYQHTEKAKTQAQCLDAQGPNPQKPLWGVPITIADNINTADIPTTSGSKMLETFVPLQDAHCVAKLKNAGAIILGKTNVDELGLGASTENSAFAISKNPWNPAHVPGGSCGGSAASVASGQCFASIGIDTTGSLRQPASFCGLVGFKASYGRVSRHGLMACASSLDQAGPMTRTVADTALILEVMAGHDPQDTTSCQTSVPNFIHGLDENSLQGLRLGLPAEYWQNLSAEVDMVCRKALDLAQSLGAELVPLSLPHTPYVDAVATILTAAEASSNLARLDGVRYGYRYQQTQDLNDLYTYSRSKGLGMEVMRTVLLGTHVLSSTNYEPYYNQAARIRRLIQQDFIHAWTSCDLICAPTCPTTAPLLHASDKPHQAIGLTAAVNLAGLPGLTLPVGLGEESTLPIGLQLMGPYLEEGIVLRTAATLEQHLPSLQFPFA